VEALEQAVSRMAEHPPGKNPSDGQGWSGIARRKALRGEIPVECLKRPVLLKSASRTPKPDLDKKRFGIRD